MGRKIVQTARGSNRKSTHPIVIIVCEGKKTEPIYFENFNVRNKNLKIAVVTGAAGKSYTELVQAAVRAKEKYTDGVEAEWQLWCVSDVDNATEKQLADYKAAVTKEGFKIALSNPCFELWYLLHYSYTTGALASYAEVVKKLPKELQPYQKNENIYPKLFDNEATAITYAEKLQKHHESQGVTDLLKPGVNPYTNVFELVSVLRG